MGGAGLSYNLTMQTGSRARGLQVASHVCMCSSYIHVRQAPNLPACPGPRRLLGRESRAGSSMLCVQRPESPRTVDGIL